MQNLQMQDIHFSQPLFPPKLQVQESVIVRLSCIRNCEAQSKIVPTAITYMGNAFVIPDIFLIAFRLHIRLPPQILFPQSRKEAVALCTQLLHHFARMRCIHLSAYRSSSIISFPVGSSVVNPISFRS